MDRNTWWVTVHGLQRLGHEATEHAYALCSALKAQMAVSIFKQ